MKKIAPLLLALLIFIPTAFSQTTEFTYQGRLISSGIPAGTPHDFEFRLFAAETGGTPLGGIVESRPGVQVSNGVFTVRLNFGDQFDGAARWLEISVRQTGGSTFATLTPRQPISSAPYGIRSSSAAGADAADSLSVNCVLCVTNAQIQSIDGGKVTGVVGVGNGGTGSSTQNFVDLSTNQFNIAGNKRFVQTTTLDFANVGSLTNNGGAVFNGTAVFNGANAVQMNALDIGNGLTADVASVSELNATDSVSGNVIDAQTHFSQGGARVLSATPEYLLLGRDVGGGAGLTRATAIGHGTQVGLSDSIVLGTTPGFFLPVPNTRVGIGVVSPTTKLDVGGQTLIRSNIANPPIGGGLRGLLNVVQTGSGDANFYMQGANGGRGINFSANASGTQDARLIISQYDGTTYQNRFTISPLGDVGIGTTTPSAKLDVAGTVRVGTIGISGINAVCLDASLIISACSSSSRYKDNINSFSSGLGLISRLRPVTFNWKADNKADMGLVAEEVAEVEPRLATYNEKGEVEGVKYDRIGVIAVNAIKEQQEQIERQQQLIEEQEKTNADLHKEIFEMREKLRLVQTEGQELKKALCALHPQLAPCKEEK